MTDNSIVSGILKTVKRRLSPIFSSLRQGKDIDSVVSTYEFHFRHQGYLATGSARALTGEYGDVLLTVDRIGDGAILDDAADY